MNRLDKLEKVQYIVNEEGEVVDEVSSDETIVKLRPGDRVYRKSTENKKDKMVSIKFPFIKLNLDAAWELTKYRLSFLLMCYIEYQTGRLVFKNGMPINRKNLAKACGVSQVTINRKLPILIEHEIVKVVKDGRDDVFFFNPFIAHIGKQVTNSLYEMFKDSYWAIKYTKRDKK